LINIEFLLKKEGLTIASQPGGAEFFE